MRINNLKAIAKVLKTTPEWLMTGAEAHASDTTIELLSIVSTKLEPHEACEVLDFARYKAAQNKTPE